MPRRDLMEYLPAEKPEDKEEAPAERPDLGEKRLLYLAEEAGAKNPAALIKLIKACCAQEYGKGSAEEE